MDNDWYLHICTFGRIGSINHMIGLCALVILDSFHEAWFPASCGPEVSTDQSTFSKAIGLADRNLCLKDLE